MIYEYKIKMLTDEFYSQYSSEQHQEIMIKEKRPYNCLMIEYNQYVICIPFRSNMKHSNGYSFKNSARSRRTRSGLDYSKLVLISNEMQSIYLKELTQSIDQDEVNETRQNMHRIVKQVTKYIKDYIDHISEVHILSDQVFNRKYQYSTLKYFHSLLSIQKKY